MSTTILEMLNGCEVNSINYEGCVAIKGDKVYLNGTIVDTLDTDEKLTNIWEEYKREEGF